MSLHKGDLSLPWGDGAFLISSRLGTPWPWVTWLPLAKGDVASHVIACKQRDGHSWIKLKSLMSLCVLHCLPDAFAGSLVCIPGCCTIFH